MPKLTPPRKDAVLLDAQNTAREAVEAFAKPTSVGMHVQAEMVAERLTVHRFECADPGYPGWVWEVSLSRAPRAKTVTVCEIHLVPGDDALLAPPWIPWEDRLLPGDVSRDDVLPYNANDPRLISGFEQTDEETMDALGIDEMGFGRTRVLSPDGLSEAAERWYASERGPTSGVKPGATCSTCGFLIKMGGSLGQVFGVCANAWAADDGTVVALEHSCGAHSETDTRRRRPQWPIVPSRVNDSEIEITELRE